MKIQLDMVKMILGLLNLFSQSWKSKDKQIKDTKAGD